MKTDSDPGPEIIDHVYTSMMVDPEWSLRNEREFTWWGHDLAQRVHAGRTHDSFGHRVAELTASIRLAENLADLQPAFGGAASANEGAGLFGWVVEPTDRTLSLVSKVTVHAQSKWKARFFATASAFQASHAFVVADAVAQQLGVDLARSHHPTSGPRNEPDEMLVVALPKYSPTAHLPVPLTYEDFGGAITLDRGLFGEAAWVSADADALGLAIEFPFGELTASLWMRRIDDPSDQEAALQEVPSPSRERMSESGAPALYGSGLSVHLTIPIRFSGTDGMIMAAELNRREALETTDLDYLGAWCSDGAGLWFTSYFPSVLFHRQTAKEIGLLNLANSFGARARWARAEAPWGRLKV